jgi:hypothetical protein
MDDTNNNILNEYLENLMVSNTARTLEHAEMLLQIEQLTRTQADLQQMLVSLAEQLLTSGLIYRPDLRGHQHLS